jgi:RNA polymerase sigma-70 factor (ECF subfamily)
MQETGPKAAWERPGEWFATTHWSVVVAAGDSESPQAAEALQRLCQRYWPPIYTFIRRRGYRPEEAQDLTQEFFARFLESGSLKTADKAKGKFRTLLLTAVTRFLAKEWERARAQKRGGGVVPFSLEQMAAEEQSRFEPAEHTTPEKMFERRWAEALLETVLGNLRREFELAGQSQRFELLKPWLTSERPAAGTELAAQLGLSESSVYSAIHRLRRRYGELLRDEIAQTVTNREEVEEELRHLLQVLSD